MKISNPNMPDTAPYSEALVTLGQVLLKAIPPEENRIARAKARSPLLAKIIDWQIKMKRAKEINRLAKIVERNNYDVDKFIMYVNNRADMSPIDSMASFLIKQRIERKLKK